MAALARSSREIESLSAAAFLLRDARAPLNRAGPDHEVFGGFRWRKKGSPMDFAEVAVAQRSSHA